MGVAGPECQLLPRSAKDRSRGDSGEIPLADLICLKMQMMIIVIVTMLVANTC